MGQEFFVKSADLESKVRQLLPSQGGLGAGFDLSASTQIVPIVDLTESAEGSDVRADLQTALSLNACTSYIVNNATTTLVSNTGYFRVFGTALSTASTGLKFEVTDGVTTKRLREFQFPTGTNPIALSYDFVVFLEAGHSLVAFSGATTATLNGTTRQIADIDGNLVNP